MKLEKLLDCIDALLDMDARKVLRPHGIGGHARSLLEEAKSQLEQLARDRTDKAKAWDAISAKNLEIARLRAQLGALGRASSDYRHNHDALGGGHIDTGRARDRLRQAEANALKLYAETAPKQTRPAETA